MAEEQVGLHRRSRSIPGACGWFDPGGVRLASSPDATGRGRSCAAGEETQRKQAELATDETRRRAYAAEISAAFQALDENNLERAIDLLDRQRPKPGEEDLRGFEWRHLWQLCQSDVKVDLPRRGCAASGLFPGRPVAGLWWEADCHP